METDTGVDSLARRWGVRPEKVAGSWIALSLIVTGLVGLPSIAVALLVGPSLGLVTAIGSAVVFGMWATAQGRLALRALGARPVAGSADERVTHMVGEISRQATIPVPQVWIVPGSRHNALVCRARGPVVAVTSGLVAEYTRTELEAVVMHCLARTHARAMWRAAIATSLGHFGRRFAPPVGEADDVAAVARTRYPPALAAAIRKADPGDSRWAPFWFVAEGAPHRSSADRIVLLADL